MKQLTEIDIREIGNIRIGNAQDEEAGTGVTVLICPDGMPAGLDIRGGGPASRETPLLNPLMDAGKIHALVLGGGSAYGLDAAGGVMQYLEEHEIGLSVGPVKVPLVCQSDIFDLGYKNAYVRPDQKMGYAACVDAEQNIPREGSVGGGTGATVGKLYGMAQCQKSGIGIYAAQVGELKIGAIVIVNALGDVFDSTGKKIAGLTNADGTEFLDFEEEMLKMLEPKETFVGNTTIGAVLTNAEFPKSLLCKIASMGQNALARRIYPVHTMMDGDSIYALSLGNVKADVNVAGMLATHVLEEAIERAVRSAGKGE